MASEMGTDILILGGGGAGLMAALHAYEADPSLDISVACKGIVGQSGCTRLVQGGYNAVLNSKDSLELHFKDTVKAGAFLNEQELVWIMVSRAPEVVCELESRFGCFFDRQQDGTIHQKPFAGQSFDRTVHRKDRTGIEIMSRLRDQLFARPIRLLEECRAIELLTDASRERVLGALLLDMRSGEFLAVSAKTVILATGGGARMYKIAAPSLEKTGDGMAMAYRAGAELIDMEMFQFHPTGLLAGASELTGMVLEEGLRGAGARLYNALGERFMERHDPERLERSTRDVVARASYMEIMAGRGTANDGVLLDISHLGSEFVESHFPGMVERCRNVGFDLAHEPVEVAPSGHFHMGGVKIDARCRSSLNGLLVAGEDAGGIHGANRLGGNGAVESTVFGAIAGQVAAEHSTEESLRPFDRAMVGQIEKRVLSLMEQREGGSPFVIRQEFEELMSQKVGVVRNGKELDEAVASLQELGKRAKRMAVPGGQRWKLVWNQALDVQNLIQVAEMTARSALCREESRGAHYREDFPRTNDAQWLKHVCIRLQRDDKMKLDSRPVLLSRVSPADLTEINAARSFGAGDP